MKLSIWPFMGLILLLSACSTQIEDYANAAEEAQHVPQPTLPEITLPKANLEGHWNLCNARGYVAGKAPQAINILKQPKATGKVIGSFPALTIVNIHAVQGSWMLVDTDMSPSSYPHPTFDALGWVWGPQLTTEMFVPHEAGGYIQLTSKPAPLGSPGNKIVGTIHGHNGTVELFGCWGKWLKIKYTDIYGSKTGWLHPDLQWPNPFTNPT